MKETSHKSKVNVFVGGSNSDTDIRYLKPDELVDAYDVKFGHASKSNVATWNPGNAIVSFYGALADESMVVGVCEDAKHGRLFYFVSGDRNIDRIYCYDPKATQKITIVAESTSFGFNRHRKISGIGIVGGRYLYWSDAKFEGTNLVGNYPMMLDTERAMGLGTKRLKYKVFTSLDRQITDDVSVTFNITNLTGTPIGSIAVSLTGDSSDGWLGQLYDEFLGAGHDVERVGNYLIVELDTASKRMEVNGSEQHVNVVPENHYPASINEWSLSVAKRPPMLAPVPRLRRGTSMSKGTDIQVLRNVNTLGHEPFQFMYRYRYFDGSYSAWSEPSRMSWENRFDVEGLIDEEYNECIVSLPDELLASENNRWVINSVDVAYRAGNYGVWYVMGTYRIEELGTSVNGPNVSLLDDENAYQGAHVVFVGPNSSVAVPSDEQGGDAGSQVLKHYDHIPTKVASMRLHTQDDGNSILFVGGGERGFDVPGSVKLVPYVILTDNVYLDDTGYPLNESRITKRSLKRAGLYRFGIVYEDGFGRCSPPIFGCELSVEDYTYSSFYSILHYGLKVYGMPPSWAKRYRIVRTQNLNQGRFKIWSTMDIGCKTAVIQKVTRKVLSTSDLNVSSLTATYLLIGVGQQQKEVDDATLTERAVFFEDDTRNTQTFFQKGSRIRFFAGGNSDTGTGVKVITQHLPFDKVFETEILGYYYLAGANANDPLQLYVIIKNDGGLRNGIKDFNEDGLDVIYEIYDKSQASSSLFFETGISHPITGSGYHGGSIDQDAPDGYASVYMRDNGDTYWLSMNGLMKNEYGTKWERVVTERMYISDLPKTTFQEDLGRISVHPYYRAQLAHNVIRWSSGFIDGGEVNGLSSWSAFDYTVSDSDYGVINCLAVLKGTLLAIGQYGTKLYYIGKSRVLDLSGATQVGRSSQVLNSANETVRSWGTHHPESVIVKDGAIFAWDGYMGVVWQFSQSGFRSISDIGQNLHFYSKAKPEDVYKYNAIGGFEPEYHEYKLHFWDRWDETPMGETSRGDSFVNCFDTKRNLWVAKESYFPDHFGTVGRKYITFKNGSLFVHVGGVGAYFNLTPHKGKVVFAIAPDPPRLAVTFMNIQVFATDLWEVVSIETLYNVSYGRTQKTIAGEAKVNEGYINFDILRDEKDTRHEFSSIADVNERKDAARKRGIPIRSHGCIVTLQCVSPSSITQLFQAETFYT